jgi:Arc/MetJ-type ribon-helix-helix transcriptional regulator
MPRQVKVSETEKVTINLGYVDLGRIDLLVEEGFYTNRTDFIRSAVRAQLDRQGAEVGALVERRVLEMGLRDVGRAELEALREAGEAMHLKVVGLVRLADDIPLELARQTIATITVLGALQASPALKEALRDRIR